MVWNLKLPRKNFYGNEVRGPWFCETYRFTSKSGVDVKNFFVNAWWMLWKLRQRHAIDVHLLNFFELIAVLSRI